MNEQDIEWLKTDNDKAKACFEGILKLLNDTQVNPPEAATALMNVLVIVWAMEIGGSREDLLGNVSGFFDRAESFMMGGGATQ